MGNLDFDTIIESIYDASDDPAGFVPALRQVGALLGASGNHTLVIETATNAVENHAYGADQESFLEYDRHWRQHDPRFAHSVERFGNALSDVAVIDSDAFERSAIYNEHLKPADARYTLFGTFRVSPELILGSAFLRPKRYGAFAENEIRHFSAITPHLVRAARLRRVVTSLRDELSDLRRALDATALPIIVLDGNATIVCANQSAEDLLATSDGLRSEKGRLSASTLSARAALEKAIARAALTADACTARGTRSELAPVIEIPRSDDTSLSVALLPLRRRNELRVRATKAARVLALVHDPSRVIRLDRALIAEQHGLTTTEAELAAQLAEGKTLAEFAAARGSSEQTARTHLKRILDKTETRRQADLVRVLLTGVAVHGLR